MDERTHALQGDTSNKDYLFNLMVAWPHLNVVEDNNEDHDIASEVTGISVSKYLSAPIQLQLVVVDCCLERKNPDTHAVTQISLVLMSKHYFARKMRFQHTMVEMRFQNTMVVCVIEYIILLFDCLLKSFLPL